LARLVNTEGGESIEHRDIAESKRRVVVERIVHGWGDERRYVIS
jgi:hypothetical protein